MPNVGWNIIFYDYPVLIIDAQGRKPAVAKK